MFDFERFIKKIGIKQIELANAIGVSAQSITQLKKGTIDMPERWKSSKATKWSKLTYEIQIMITFCRIFRQYLRQKFIPDREQICQYQ